MTRWIGLLFLITPLYSQEPGRWKDPSPHTTRLVTVDDGVRLEVLDWGGSGRPLILLAGGGNTAHVFDDFAPKLSAECHVYGITRRGFGASGFSAQDFGPDRLGEDVLAVIDSLKLARPVLAAHSIGGEELSSVASRRPERIAGVIYLDAAYPYAFDNGKGPGMQDIQSLQQSLPAPQPPEPGRAELAGFRALYNYFVRVNGFAYPEAELRQTWESTPEGRVTKGRDFPGGPLLMTGLKKYTEIRIPALAIFANPHGLGAWVDHNTDPAVRKAANAYSAGLSALVERQMKVFQGCAPIGHVVVLHGAHHYVYLSNENDVLREMRAFLKGLE
jgi:pimeloyl-ACP methyl ester carboxylesterase